MANTESMTESEAAEVITSILGAIGEDWGSDSADDVVSMTDQDEGKVEALCTARITPWSRETMLTDNAGFTLRCEDGSEFQVTVVRSK